MEILKGIIEQNGFDFIEETKFSIVNLVATNASYAYHVAFYEDIPEKSTDRIADQRLSENKRAEIERISRCSSAEEILGIPRGASITAVNTAYKKKNMLVHPDNNGFEGASEAAKYVSMAKTDLLGGSRSLYKPKLFEVIDPPEPLPKLMKLIGGKTRLFLMDTITDKSKLGRRFNVSLESPVESKKVAAFLENAWKRGEVEAGGELAMDMVYNIDSVRLKYGYLFTDGEFDLKLESVRQKTTRTFGKFTDFPEIILSCPALTEAMQSGHDLDRVPDLFCKLMDRASKLADAFSSASERIQ